MLFYGALGWLVDRLAHTNFLLPVGLVFGIAVSLYMIIKRFGQEHPS
jgi:F0F1-type ATP synthase assembly protein I